MSFNIIFTRSFKKLRMGGVFTYVRELAFHLNNDMFNIVNMVDSKNRRLEEVRLTNLFENILLKIKVILYFFQFGLLLKKYNVNIVHSNPSLLMIPLIRESFFILLSSILRKKILVFFHGWREREERMIRYNRLVRYLFCKVFNRADVILVLSKHFKKTLEEVGITGPVLTETIMVEDGLIDHEGIKNKLSRYTSDHSINILFLSRITREKGIYEAVQAFEILIQKYNHIEFIVAGDGEELQSIKGYVEKNRILNVKFPGYLKDEAKKSAFMYADIYVFPSYTEGMPISVVEAMAFGLPVVTTPVGALNDFFVNGRHGFLAMPKSPESIAFLLEKLICNPELRQEMGWRNYRFATELFLSSVVTKRMEAIYLDLAMRNTKHTELVS